MPCDKDRCWHVCLVGHAQCGSNDKRTSLLSQGTQQAMRTSRLKATKASSLCCRQRGCMRKGCVDSAEAGREQPRSILARI